MSTSLHKEKMPWLSISVLLLAGAGGAGFALWLADHPSGLPYPGRSIALGMGAFFLCFTWALFKFLGWRDRTRVAPPPPDALARAWADAGAPASGTVYDLVPGVAYVVREPFTDYYGNRFERDERLRFVRRHFLPYEGGHTLVFEERTVYLQEERNRDLVDGFSRYVVPARQ